MSRNVSIFPSRNELPTQPFREEIQFTYYIVPDSHPLPVVWAITATAYTLTVYTQPNTYDSLTSHLQPAAGEYAAKVSNFFETPVIKFRLANQGFYSVHRDAPEHRYLHSADPGELPIIHYHLRNPRRVLTLTLVRDLIKLIQQSEQDLIKINDLPEGEKFMTHTVRKDIVSRYSDFKARQARGEIKGVYNASNSKFYEKHINQLTIGTHGKCLELPTRFMGCTLDNPHTPETIRSLYPSYSLINNTALTKSKTPMRSTDTPPDFPTVINTESSAVSSAMSSSFQPTIIDLSEAVNMPSIDTTSARGMLSSLSGGASEDYLHTQKIASPLMNTISIESKFSPSVIGVPILSLTVGVCIALRLCGFFRKKNNELKRQSEGKEKTPPRVVNSTLV